jgi:hypothetical protein
VARVDLIQTVIQGISYQGFKKVIQIIIQIKILDLDKSVFFIKQTCLKEEVTGFLKRRDI